MALALHSALQGACVCHLATTATPIGATTPRNTSEWLQYYEERRTNPEAKMPKTRLMELPELLKAIRKPHSAGDRSNDFGVAISDGEFNWLRRFHETVRNQFVHFEPMGWSLEVSGIPSIAALAARIIADIRNAGWAFRHQETSWHEALSDDLRRLANIGSQN